MRKRTFLAAAVSGVLLAFGASVARAQTDPGWELETSSAAGPGGAVPTPGSPTAPDWQKFWDNLQNRAFNDLCRNIKIPLNQSFVPVDFASIGVFAERGLASYPNNTWAVVDKARLSVSLGYTQPLAPTDFPAESFPVPVGLSFQGAMQGEADVIRPLEGATACRELKTLANVFDYKSVVPMTVQRLTRMKIGELWKLPMVWRTGISLGAGASEGIGSISVSVGVARQETASVTLLRVSTDTLRLRVRLDRANLLDASGGIQASVPIADLMGLGTISQFPLREGERLMLGEINRYLSNSLGIDYWKHSGRKFLLEFDLNPNDPEQMNHLAAFLKGNVSAFAMLKRVIKFVDPRPEQIRGQLADIERRDAAILGLGKSLAAASFAGADDYKRDGDRFHAQVPFLVRHESGAELQNDSIISGGSDYTTEIREKSAPRGIAWIDIPLLGQMFKKNSQSTIRAMARTDGRGRHPDVPSLSFVKQVGFLRHRQRTAREMVTAANAILRFAGTGGNGESRDLLLPVEKMFPEADASNPLYRSAVSAFTLTFNERAIHDILFAPAELVVKAFANVIPEKDRALLGLALEHGKIRADGTFDVDRKTLWEATLNSRYDDEEHTICDRVIRVASRAAGLVRDLIEARAKDWRQLSQSMVDMVSSGGRSGLKYDDAIKVLVQLVRREDLFGEFRMQTNKKIKGAEDVSARYLLHWNRIDSAYKDEVDLKNKFAEPSLLSN